MLVQDDSRCVKYRTTASSYIVCPAFSAEDESAHRDLRERQLLVFLFWISKSIYPAMMTTNDRSTDDNDIRILDEKEIQQMRTRSRNKRDGDMDFDITHAK